MCIRTLTPASRAASTYASAAATVAGRRIASHGMTYRTFWMPRSTNSGATNMAACWSPTPRTIPAAGADAGRAVATTASAARTTSSTRLITMVVKPPGRPFGARRRAASVLLAGDAVAVAVAAAVLVVEPRVAREVRPRSRAAAHPVARAAAADAMREIAVQRRAVRVRPRCGHRVRGHRHDHGQRRRGSRARGGAPSENDLHDRPVDAGAQALKLAFDREPRRLHSCA